MSRTGLSPAARSRARKTFSVFSVFNTFSYFLLTGNLLTLFLLRIGATSTFIGLVSALPYVSFFFMLVGRRLVARRPLRFDPGIGHLLHAGAAITKLLSFHPDRVLAPCNAQGCEHDGPDQLAELFAGTACPGFSSD